VSNCSGVITTFGVITITAYEFNSSLTMLTVASLLLIVDPLKFQQKKRMMPKMKTMTRIGKHQVLF